MGKSISFPGGDAPSFLPDFTLYTLAIVSQASFSRNTVPASLQSPWSPIPQGGSHHGNPCLEPPWLWAIDTSPPPHTHTIHTLIYLSFIFQTGLHMPNPQNGSIIPPPKKSTSPSKQGPPISLQLKSTSPKLDFFSPTLDLTFPRWLPYPPLNWIPPQTISNILRPGCNIFPKLAPTSFPFLAPIPTSAN